MIHLILLIFAINLHIIGANLHEFNPDSNAIIVFSTSDGQIREKSFNKSIISYKVSETIKLYDNQFYANTIDFNYRSNYLLFCVSNSGIYVAPWVNRVKNTLNISRQKLIVETDCKSMAFDWIHQLIYYTDGKYIYVSNIIKPNAPMIWYNKMTTTISGIAVNPIEQFVVWAHDYGLIKSSLDGSQQIDLVKTSLTSSTCVTIDLSTKKIYWIDARFNSLNCINYDGSDKRKLINSNSLFSKAVQMDLFDDYIYWSASYQEYSTSSYQYTNSYDVLRTHKYGYNSSIKSTFIKSLNSIYGMKIIHASKQPNATNVCANNPCSHLCLPKNSTNYQCICPSTQFYNYSVFETCLTFVSYE